jgi:GMP synthase-like glutamine amidotransferase
MGGVTRAPVPSVPTVAIIDNSIEPEVYRPVEHWAAHLGAPWRAFTARRGEFPDPEAFSHVILTGSEASILERDPWVETEAAFVREAAAGGAAVLGSCWGHQLIAYALAGESRVARCPSPEIGWIPIRIDRASELLGPAGEEPYVFSVHFDEVRDLPPGFEVLASSEGCAVHAFGWSGRPVWGLQSHPEIDIPSGRAFLEDLIERGFKGREAMRRALGREPRDSGLIRGIVRAFLASGPAAPGNR